MEQQICRGQKSKNDYIKHLMNEQYYLFFEESEEEDIYAVILDSEQRFLCNIYEEETLKELRNYKGDIGGLFDILGESFYFETTDAEVMFKHIFINDLEYKEVVDYLMQVLRQGATFESEILGHEYVNAILDTETHKMHYTYIN